MSGNSSYLVGVHSRQSERSRWLATAAREVITCERGARAFTTMFVVSPLMPPRAVGLDIENLCFQNRDQIHESASAENTIFLTKQITSSICLCKRAGMCMDRRPL